MIFIIYFFLSYLGEKRVQCNLCRQIVDVSEINSHVIDRHLADCSMDLSQGKLPIITLLTFIL